MAFLSDDDLATLRGMIGDVTPPTDPDLEDAYDRLGSIYLVAKEVLQGRLGTYLANPASFSVSGYSENASANISGLQKQLDDLDKIITGLGLQVQGQASTISFGRIRPIR